MSHTTQKPSEEPIHELGYDMAGHIKINLWDVLSTPRHNDTPNGWYPGSPLHCKTRETQINVPNEILLYLTRNYRTRDIRHALEI